MLIIDRDASSVCALQKALAQADFTVTVECRGQTLEALEHDNPDLVVLDWNLPALKAIELLRRLQERRRWQRPRVLAISEPCDEQQILQGFELGADDFVFKPYSVAEVIARVRALLRGVKRREQTTDIVEFHALRADAYAGTLTASGRKVDLRRQEFRLMHFLIQHAERVFTREQLLTRIWGYPCSADDRAVDVTVQRTRKALSAHGCADYLQTVRGVGYRLSYPASAGRACAGRSDSGSRNSNDSGEFNLSEP